MEIEQIRKLCAERKIKWSLHAAQRIMERGIDRADVLSCLENGEIIEDYPTDFPNPSCLVFGYSVANKVLHVVVGSNGDMLFIITAYFPTTEKFEADLKTRKVR